MAENAVGMGDAQNDERRHTKMISHTIKLRQAPLGAEDPEAGAFAFRSAYAARSFALGHADALSRLG